LRTKFNRFTPSTWVLAAAALAFVRREFCAKLKRFGGRGPFVEDLTTAYSCALDPAAPMWARGMLLTALVYFILPFDLVPDMVPGLGLIDDAALLAAVIGLVSSRITPTHRAGAMAMRCAGSPKSCTIALPASEASRPRVAIFNNTDDATTRTNRHFGCALVMRNLMRLLRENDLDTVFSWPVNKDWRASEDQIPRDLDAVIVNGEGSIHHSATRWKPHALLALARFARCELRVPAFLINATIYDLEPMLFDELRLFTAVYVRDSASERLLATHGIRASTVPDLTFAFPLPDPPQNRFGICAADSTMDDVARALKQFCRKRDYSYLPIRQPIYSSWRRWPDRLYPAPSFDRLLSRYELAITGRFHGATACLLTRTPFVAVESNTPKIATLLDDVFGSRSRLLDVEQIDRADLASFSSWSAAETAAINRYCADGAGRCHHMASELASVIGSGKPSLSGRASEKTALPRNAMFGQ
jgi:uncharacterized membrane protein YkvA (DUF1232 family)